MDSPKAMPGRKRVLLVGGGGKAPPTDGPPLPDHVKAAAGTPQNLKQVLQNMIDEAARKGYDVRVVQLGDESKSLEWAEEIKTALASERWDGFIIGNGIRGTPSLTEK